MKKYLLILVVALAVIFAFPMTVTAQGPNQVIVSGSILSSIDITLSANDISFGEGGNLAIGENQAGPITLSVNTNEVDWNVDAVDDNQGANTGHMVATGSALTDPIQLSKDGSNWVNLNWEPILSGTSSSSTPVYFQQDVLDTDNAGDYTIQVDFNAEAP
jgi:spore coat protein U-like protein